MARFSKTKTWRRWSGQRDVLTRAIEIAADALSEWSGYPSQVSTRIALRTGLTERSAESEFLQRLDARDLHDLEEARVEIAPSREAWRARLLGLQDEWQKAGTVGDPPDLDDLPEASVTFRASHRLQAVHVEVEGPERDRVEGLAARLVSALDAGRPPLVLRYFTRELTVPLLATVLLIGGVVVGAPAARLFGLAERNDRVEPAEIAGLILCPLLGLAAAGIIYWLTPTLEILDEGERRRSQRARRISVGVASAIILGIIATGIYEAFAS